MKSHEIFCAKRGSRLTLLDLDYLGNREVIASYLLQSGHDIALVDPGPASALPVLRAKLQQEGLTVGDIRTVLLTHIHLDHAGATGSLVSENPKISVYVHQRGATHLINPERLIRSAERVFGNQMKRLWGEMSAVPAANVQALV